MTELQREQYKKQLRLIAKMLQRLSMQMERNITVTNLHYYYVDDEAIDKTSIFIGIKRTDPNESGVNIDGQRSVHGYIDEIDDMLIRLDMIEKTKKKDKEDD